jgi:hypothetical protein
MATKTVTLKQGTPFKAGVNDVQLGADASVVFQNAGSLDEVAEQLASISPLALAMNRVTAGLDRQELAVGVLPVNYPDLILGSGVTQYVEGDALDITYDGHGKKVYTDRGQPPALLTASVENAAPTILVLTFDKDVNSLSADYLTGLSCKVGGVNRVINSVARQANNAILWATLASAVVNGNVVLCSYNSATGNLKSDNGAAAQSFTDHAVTNNVA